jgi:hypothetical protein
VFATASKGVQVVKVQAVGFLAALPRFVLVAAAPLVSREDRPAHGSRHVPAALARALLLPLASVRWGPSISKPVRWSSPAATASSSTGKRRTNREAETRRKASSSEGDRIVYLGELDR